MKNHPYAILLALLTFAGQNAQAQAYAELDINDVRARFYAYGIVGYNANDDQPNFEVPAGQGTHGLFSAGLWIAGTDPANMLRVAAMQYEGSSGSDFYPGPLTTDGTASVSPEVSEAYDQVWSVSRAQVEAHTAYFGCLADPNCDVTVEFPNGYTIPSSILDWPAINNEPGYSTYLAPFYDFDQDGDYVPANGDAPCILGDQALYFVFNDKGGSHLGSGGLPIGVEIQAMPFAYTGSPYLDQTVFVHYHIVNRGTETLTDTRIGVFNDFDLGCADDDFIGSDPARNMAYAYNWDDEDEDCGETVGYGTQPPAFGHVLLKGALLDPDGMDNPQANSLPAWNGFGFGDTIGDNERSGLGTFIYFNRQGSFNTTDPTLPVHYNNYMRAIWKDGTPFTYGGSGYNPNDPQAVPCKYVYPDDTDPVGAGTNGVPQAPWLEVSQAQVDRRGLSSTGAFTLEPGEHVDLLYAYVYARAGSGEASASVAALQARVDSVSAFANTLPLWNIGETQFQGGCEGISATGLVEMETSVQLQLFPVPATTTVQFTAPASQSRSTLLIQDAIGRTVATHRLVAGLNTIDVTELARGIYTCEVRGANTRLVGRLVKE